MPARKLRQALKKQIAAFEGLPNHGSFSAIAIGKRISRIQQILEKRKIKFEPYILEITIEVP